MTIYKRYENSSAHLSNDDLLKYHRKLLSAEEVSGIKNHLEACTLCSDALKGIAEMNNAMQVFAISHELKKRMKKRLSVKRTIFSRFELLTILLVFFIIGLILFLSYYFLMTKW